jgi:YidC/Oxa1 family membrane protein insertase
MLVYANIFQPLIDVFEAVLKFFHNSIGVPWGWSIVLLTIAMRAVLLPLTLKQFHSMQKMQVLAPQMKEVQKKYKEDKQRQQQEIMKLYQEHKINPLSSCLPLVAQIPVFISLFYMLRQSLRADICPQVQHHILVNGHYIVDRAHTVVCGPHHGAGFLFISDLTNKATGATLVVLIILYVGTQLLSTQLMQTPGMDATMKRVTQLMPLFFVIFIISFPAGVIVYWITTNAWTMAQQLIIRRLLPAPVLAAAGEGPSGGGGSGGRGGGGSGGPRGGDDGRNGAGSGGGLGALLRGRTKESEEPAGVGAKRTTRTAAPPPPPRKKKKRSGRRR